ncbi:MAG TPA: hypothetical protein VMS31_23015, partial [Pyrinomonadaceae bacterium]|nr:hypothetical protein [Pyrinomonadaceae bacterium]
MDQATEQQPPPLNRASSLWRTLSPTGNTGDAIFRLLLLAAASLMVLIVGSMILALAAKSMPTIRQV